MKFFDRTLKEDCEDSPLSEALFNYGCALSRGNYEILDFYIPSTREWTDTDEIKAVCYMLKPLLPILRIDGIDSMSLKDKLYRCVPIDFPKIAHLSASLHIMKNQLSVAPSEELEALKGIGVLVQAEAAMPVPCLAYLGALRYAIHIEDIIKLSLIDCIIIKIQHKKDIFGTLSHLVLRTAIKDWTDIIKKSKFSSTESVQAKMQRYKTIESSCLSVEAMKAELSLIEQYTLLICEKLKNGIGKIHLIEPNVIQLESH